jgi:hypothetical protein
MAFCQLVQSGFFRVIWWGFFSLTNLYQLDSPNPNGFTSEPVKYQEIVPSPKLVEFALPIWTVVGHQTYQVGRSNLRAWLVTTRVSY